LATSCYSVTGWCKTYATYSNGLQFTEIATYGEGERRTLDKIVAQPSLMRRIPSH
jgi:hypothetical protein